MTNRKNPTAISRMKQDYMRLKRDPLPYITAEPLPSNLLEWHYVVKGPEDSPYQGGYYHGTLLFPREFPFKPPSIYMLTPNGRFKTNTRLCLSISDFHPDTWNPTWSVGTILTGLLSFMLETTPTLGSTESTLYEKQQYAKKSLAFNLKNQNFRDLFPEICNEINKRLQNQHQQLIQASTSVVVNVGGSLQKITLTDGVSFQNNIDCASRTAAIENNDVATKSVENKANMAGNGVGNSYSNWQSVYSNLIIVISFVIFALIVNYVLKNLSQE